MPDIKTEKSIGELLSELTRETSTLVRKEVQLAKTEMAQKAASFIKSIALLMVAALLGIIALQALVVTAILAFALVLPAWEAALVVAAVLICAAALLAIVGLSAMKKGGLTPKETLQTIKEDAIWAKHQMG